MNLIYTLGYSGWKPAHLAQVAQDYNLTICDIRYKPFSRVPHWNVGPLAQLLGDRYAQIHALGNKNYKGQLAGPDVQLVDLIAGALAVQSIFNAGRSVGLLCACEKHEDCHRAHAAVELSIMLDGVEIRHLYPQGVMGIEAPQPPRFVQASLF